MPNSQHTETICIVIPCYNSQDTLSIALNSAIEQSHQTEIVVVDDGSIDNSLAVARSFEPRVRVLTGPNAGVSSARNKGLSKTSADWVVFLDADDILMPNTLSVRLVTAKATGADVIVCDWEEFVDNGSDQVIAGPLRTLSWNALQQDAEVATATCAWATTAAILYRRSLAERIGGFRLDLPVIQDARFLFDAAYHGAKFAHSPHVGAMYRVLPGSLSRRNSLEFWADVMRNGEQIEELWRARGYLSATQRNALHGIFDNAARVFFWHDLELYRRAFLAIERVGVRPSRFVTVTRALTSVIGPALTRQLIGLFK